ncbi:hypothetical protein [Corynebacterium sp. H113]|uniref:hypothetical protein n=1 Tax=Corynebacterium sp. H113 TaxID=3133419 RepID=UPI0030B14DB8
MATVDKNFIKKLGGDVPVGKTQRETERNLEKHFKKAGLETNSKGIRDLAKNLHKK